MSRDDKPYNHLSDEDDIPYYTDESVEEDSKLSSKERKKRDRKLARKYLKARFNEKIGYRFQAQKEYRKEQKSKKNKRFFRLSYKWMAVLLAAIFIAFVIFNVHAVIKTKDYQKEADHYAAETKKIAGEQSDLSNNVDRQTRKVQSLNKSNSAGVIRAIDTLNELFNNMYDYNDGQMYVSNYKKSMEFFDDPNADYVKKVYSNGKDADGQNVIDALDLSSDLVTISIYSEHTNDVDRKVVNLKALVAYKAYSEGSSGKFTTRTHEAVYSIDYDTTKNKIVDMKKDANLKMYSQDINTLN